MLTLWVIHSIIQGQVNKRKKRRRKSFAFGTSSAGFDVSLKETYYDWKQELVIPADKTKGPDGFQRLSKNKQDPASTPEEPQMWASHFSATAPSLHRKEEALTGLVWL